MVTETTAPTEALEKSAFAQQTPLLIHRLDSAMTNFSKEHEGINPLAAVAALTYVLCHAALASGLSRKAVIAGVEANFDHINEMFNTEGRPIQ